MKLSLADVQGADNLDLGASGWIRVDQDKIDQFAEATEDRQWIHVDVERARGSEAGGTIAHGFLLLSLLPKLFFEIVEFPDLGRMLNFGVEKVRFLRPVPSGSEIRLEARLVSARKRAGGYLMRIYGEMCLRDSGRRAMVTEVLFLGFPDDPTG